MANKKETTEFYDSLPNYLQKKIDNFSNAIGIYFKNQEIAAKALKVSQPSLNRYMRGVSEIPMSVANRLVNKSQGAILLDDIYFDHAEYLEDVNKEQQKLASA